MTDTPSHCAAAVQPAAHSVASLTHCDKLYVHSHHIHSSSSPMPKGGGGDIFFAEHCQLIQGYCSFTFGVTFPSPHSLLQHLSQAHLLKHLSQECQNAMHLHIFFLPVVITKLITCKEYQPHSSKCSLQQSGTQN